MRKRALIVDDEPLAVRRLARLLTNIDVDVVASGSNGDEAFGLCKLHVADVLFLDINMPICNGLDAARKIVSYFAQPPAIVFCTAYDEFALAAFESQAVAYLVKPIFENDLRSAINKASKLNRLQLRELSAAEQRNSTISIAHDAYIEKKSRDDILYFRAEEKVVLAGLIDQTEMVVNYTIKSLEERFVGAFLRVHRKSLINKRYLHQLVRDDVGQFQVSVKLTERIFGVSRRHLAKVRKGFN